MILKNGKRLDGCSDTVPVGTLNPFLGSVAPYGYLICAGQLVSKTTYKELYEICGDSFGEGTTTEFRLPDLRGKTITGYKEGDATFGTLGGLIGALTHTHGFAHTHGVPGVAHTHTTGGYSLTEANLPSHSHSIPALSGTAAYQQLIGYTIHVAGDEAFIGGIVSHVTNDTGIVREATTQEAGSVKHQINASHSHSVTTTASATGKTGSGTAHNHGDTGSTTPSATTTNSQSTSTTGSTSNLQPSINMNWIVKAFLLMPNQSYVENSLDSESTINSLSAAKGKELHTRLSSIENRLVVNSGNLVITPSVDVTKDYSTVSSSYLSYQASIAHP